MSPKIRRRLTLDAVLTGVVLIVAIASLPLAAAAKVTSPKEQFGFSIGDDYQLVNYKQLVAYWKKLDAESNRMKLVEIGKTAEGRTMVMAIVTSPANHGRLARYKDIATRLALAKGLSESDARRLAAEGKAVVWIDGGLHATEILGSQQLVELVWRMVSGATPRPGASSTTSSCSPCRPTPTGSISSPTGTCARRNRPSAR